MSKGAARLMKRAGRCVPPGGIRANAIPMLSRRSDDRGCFGCRNRKWVKYSSRRFDPGGSAQDAADTVLYLASALDDYVEGESLTGDGGVTNTSYWSGLGTPTSKTAIPRFSGEEMLPSENVIRRIAQR